MTGPVITVHFYALSAGYRMHVEGGDNLKLSYIITNACKVNELRRMYILTSSTP